MQLLPCCDFALADMNSAAQGHVPQMSKNSVVCTVQVDSNSAGRLHVQ